MSPSSQKKFFFFFIFLVLTASSCAGPKPILEHSIAHRALSEAKKSEAPRRAPKLWRQSRQTYRKAMQFLKAQKNKKAKEAFIKAKNYAEKAETKALIKKSDSGEFSW